MKRFFRTLTVLCCVLAVGVGADALFGAAFVAGEAEAIIGRPRTPVSVAGAARRTTRRVIRRSAVYAATLPRGCSTVVIEGTALHQCGGTYYQTSGSQYVVVYVD